MLKFVLACMLLALSMSVAIVFADCDKKTQITTGGTSGPDPAAPDIQCTDPSDPDGDAWQCKNQCLLFPQYYDCVTQANSNKNCTDIGDEWDKKCVQVCGLTRPQCTCTASCTNWVKHDNFQEVWCGTSPPP